MFTHTARDDADVAYRTVFKDQEATIADRTVAHAVFVDPEIAAVGLALFAFFAATPDLGLTATSPLLDGWFD